MGNKKIYIITNESISDNSENYSCDNLDLKSIPEGLSKNFDTTIIARKSNLKRYHIIDNIKFQLAENIFKFSKLIFQSIKDKEKSKYLIISITPFTFLACIILFLFKVKPLVYLRSDGYKEYKSILGNLGTLIYHIMFVMTSLISNFISCRDHILRGKIGKIVSPSQLTDKWSVNQIEANLESAKLLYVGRLRIEKGIFSLLEIFKKFENNTKLTIVSSLKDHTKIKKYNNENLICIDTQPESQLINLYDNNNIFILPSFTEGHPQVLDEALMRHRPVIVFNEIEHVKRERKGIFVCKREINDLNKTIEYILSNYPEIQKNIKENKLPNKLTFLKELETIINESNN